MKYFQKSSALSKQSATYMDRLSEHASEEEDEAVGDQSSHWRASTTGSNDGPPESSSSFSLARSETRMIRRSKTMLLAVVALLAVAMGCVTYYVVRSSEDAEYHARFHAIANEIAEFAQVKTVHVFNNLENFGVSMTSYAQDQNMTWPFVAFPDFQVRGILSNEETGAHTLSVNPFVYPKQLEVWGRFTQYKSDWMAEAHVYDKQVHEELYVLDHHNTSDAHHNPDFHWTKVGITPYIWYTDGGKADTNYTARYPVEESLLYTPIWQRAPPCDYQPQINLDLRSDPVFQRFIDGMIDTEHAVITQVTDATYLDTNYESRFDPAEQAEPHSYILEPVYDTLTENRTMVAYLSAFMRWGVFFTDVLPDHEQDIYVVLESTCGQTFTYEIFGHKSVYLGEGDVHDTTVDEGGQLYERFEFAPFSALEREVGEHGFCHYYATIYPSPHWRSKFFSNEPIAYALGVVGCFLITAAVFMLYDMLVQKRQDKVMASAKKTNAIVTSLFPENVRDRLLQDINNESGPETPVRATNSKKRGSWADPSNAFTVGGAAKEDNDISSERIFGSKPIADLFPATTIMFADMVGFTAWSSVREPAQVFSLLETVYHSFDVVAKRRRVFKVETVGDCYVAVAGLPMPRKEHAVVMAKFATDCLHRMKSLVHQLETTLGPDTADLDMRVGLHSGPVTAGVLRGDKGRFQLFGDTMNTASRLESTGCPGRIHISRDTAEILVASGKDKWVTQRDDEVFAKGKGTLQTYWLRIQAESCNTGSKKSNISTTSLDAEQTQAEIARKKALALGPAFEEVFEETPDTNFDLLSVKKQRLVKWNVEILIKILRLIMARRASLESPKEISKRASKKITKLNGTVLDEVADVLALPQFDAKTYQNHVDPNTIEIPDTVVEQLTDMVSRIASLYQDNPFHSFEHASHVTMSVVKLLSRIVNPIEVSTREGTNDQIASELHDHTFGITSDPLTQFACIISALIHDADHPGVPNSTLVKEEHPLASKYKNKSVAEQNSVDLAWEIIMSQEYKDLQTCICGTKDEMTRFRSIIVNVVMATDIIDKDLGAQRKARWEKAFAEDCEEMARDPLAINRKATIVLEHLMQASDVSHTMQHWVVFRKWNERLFNEMYQAFVDGRSDRDPSKGWYQGELGFFDYYIIPLAKKLETCGVFGVSSHEYLSYAQANRREWEGKGEQLVKDYLWRFHNSKTNECAHAECQDKKA
ncbi:Receptor-type guanylate cyclase gcy [Seminavis robusta]|uniref:Receptor-type guanylate cyclase gcy n=1 Tax=Seminavis robusta TaxID=568900 RepID=A0A9N8DR60_9STRA|nr:Receptor-type guanylate cyclase gcy [Seminavis robusta]|eukprot:Sro222_g091260.1 Receptor-type guanylate cyclase gcy (1215) ;mRNA; f:83550-87752